ncbi:MAG: OmpA family protein [Minwuia sp.]|nr:OmpA family protein [Minwuia sp.]
MRYQRKTSTSGRLPTLAGALLAAIFVAMGPGLAASWGGSPIPSPYATYDSALTTRYAALSDMESADGDSSDEWHFWYKSRDADGGYLVLPEDPAHRVLSDGDRAYARQAYRRLLRAYSSGMPATRTATLADAQANFDCWLNDTEEGKNPARADACRQRLEDSMALIDPQIWPAPAPKPVKQVAAIDATVTDMPVRQPQRLAAAALPVRHLLFFRLNSAELTPEALEVLDSAARDAAAFPTADIRVAGFTDRTGDDEYNRKLSLRRTAAVSRALRARGIDVIRVDEVAIGETTQAFPTADNVAEPRNRRVEIEIGLGY